MSTRGRVVRWGLVLVVTWVAATAAVDWLLFKERIREARTHLTMSAEASADLLAMLLADGRPTPDGSDPIARLRDLLRNTPLFGNETPLQVTVVDELGARLLGLGEGVPDTPLAEGSAMARAAHLGQRGVGGSLQDEPGWPDPQVVAFAPVRGTGLVVLTDVPLSRLKRARWFSAVIALGVLLPLLLTAVYLTRRSTANLRHRLHESEDLTRRIIDSAIDAVISIDAQGRILTINPSGLAMFGYAAKEVLGRDIAMLMPDRYARFHADYLARYRQTGTPSIIGGRRVVHGLRKDGTEVPMELSVSESFTEQGPIYTGILRDVTERTKAEADLQANERLLDTLVNALPIPVLMKDREGRYRLVNRALAEHFGVPAQAMIGRTTSEVLADRPEDAARIEADERQVLERGEVLELAAFPTRRANGGVMWQHLIKVPTHDTEGNVTGLVGLAEDITSRRQAEDALESSRARLLQAQRVAQLAYWEWDVETDRVAFADEVYDLLGRTQEDMPADIQACRRVTHPDDLPLLLSRLAEIKHSGRATEVDHRILLPDGAVRHIHQQFEVFKDHQGRPRRVLGVMQDVTQRTRTDQALKASQRLLQAVFDTIPFPVTVKDRDSRYVMVNRGWLERYGQPRDNADTVIGCHTMDIEVRPEEERREAVALDQRVLAGEPQVSLETRRTLNNGEQRIYRAIKTGLRDESGALNGVVSIDVDITEARHKEEALQASQRLLRTVVDAIPQLLMIKDREGRYLAVNRAWQQTYGMSEAEVLGKTVSELPLRHPEDVRLSREADDEVLSGTFEHRIVESMRHNAQGEPFYVQDVRTPLRGEQGEVIGLVDLALDVTERRRTEDALRQTMRHVALVQQVAVAANEAATPEVALQVGLREICRAEEWMLGHAYLCDPDDPTQFFSTGLWHEEVELDCRPLRDASRAIPPVSGQGLPGLAIEARRPVLIADLREDSRFLRRDALGTLPFASGLAVPVLVGSQVMGVLEFFGSARSEAPAMLELLAQVGTQLGRVVERHQAARELRESEERFRNLIEGSIQGVVIMVDMEPAFANQAVADIFGYGTPQDFMAQWKFDHAFPPERAAQLRRNHAARMRGESVAAFYETEAVRQDGTHIWVETNARRILWEGRPAIQITTHEITERKLAESALRASERRFRRLIEGSSHGIVIHHRGTPLFVNKAFAQLFGYDSPDALMGLRQLDALLDPDDMPAVFREQEALDEGASAGEGQVQVTGLRRDGTRIQVELFFQSIEWQDRRCIQVTVLDVSDRVRLESQLRQAQKMEAVGQLAGGVAHDFNNILQIIRGYAELARMRMEKPPESEYLDKVLQASQGASQVVRQLLALSRREVLRPKTVNLAKLVHDLMQMVRRLIGEHIDLQIRPGEHPILVHADRAMLEQVLLNLCVNARDAMPDGGTLTIELGAEHIPEDWAARLNGATEGSYAVISVADTGTGMTPEVREHIFEPFFTTKDAGKGTGLGLSTAYGIVQQHRGLMDVESKPGDGSIFRIYLPLRVEAPSHPASDAPGEVPGGSETVLVAEDEPGVLELMVQLLEGRGYRVLTARDGEEAVRVFSEHAKEIQLAILDVVMPRQSGRAVYEAIRAQRPDLRVLFNTGYSAEALDEDFVRTHRFHLIRKPYTPRQLLETVREALDSPWPPAAQEPGASQDTGTLQGN